MIPKIIHQTWKTKDIPNEWLTAQESIKNIYKDYKHILWTHDSMNKFVNDEYPTFYKTYISYTYDIQRCDAFRYLVLYKYGGIYFDLDVICKKEIPLLLLNKDFVLAENIGSALYSGKTYTNALFIVIPKHPFIKYCIDNLAEYQNSWSLFGKHLHVMNSTGPIFLSKMINNYGLHNIKNHYILFKKEWSGDCNSCNLNKCNGGIYFSHLEGKSWHSIDSTISNYIVCNYHEIICILLILLIIISIK